MKSYERSKILIEFILDKHKDQTDKQGVPYSRHLFQTASLVPPELYIIALAHDILEDTDTTAADLYHVGFTPYEVNLITALTKGKHESRLDYLTRVRAHSPQAVKIKIADVISNVSRLSTLDYETQIRLEYKYYETLTFLAGVH